LFVSLTVSFKTRIKQHFKSSFASVMLALHLAIQLLLPAGGDRAAADAPPHQQGNAAPPCPAAGSLRGQLL